MTDSRSSRARQRTPDVLAELLSADLPPVETSPAPSTAMTPAPSAAPPAPARAAAPKSQVQRPPELVKEAWEVEIVTFQDHRGWRPRFVNGMEVQNWLTGSLVQNYVNQRGADGWELAGATSAGHLYGVSDGLQLYFKRRKKG